MKNNEKSKIFYFPGVVYICATRWQYNLKNPKKFIESSYCISYDQSVSQMFTFWIRTV